MLHLSALLWPLLGSRWARGAPPAQAGRGCSPGAIQSAIASGSVDAISAELERVRAAGLWRLREDRAAAGRSSRPPRAPGGRLVAGAAGLRSRAVHRDGQPPGPARLAQGRNAADVLGGLRTHRAIEPLGAALNNPLFDAQARAAMARGAGAHRRARRPCPPCARPRAMPERHGPRGVAGRPARAARPDRRRRGAAPAGRCATRRCASRPSSPWAPPAARLRPTGADPGRAGAAPLVRPRSLDRRPPGQRAPQGAPGPWARWPPSAGQAGPPLQEPRPAASAIAAVRSWPMRRLVGGGSSASATSPARRLGESSRPLWSACWPWSAAVSAGCQKKKPAHHRYYDQHIQPIFDSFCVGKTSPCHRVDPATGRGARQPGPLVVRGGAKAPRRAPQLRRLPAAAAAAQGHARRASVLIPYDGRLLPSEIRHAGGKTLSPSSDAFFELKRWIDNGATRDGLGPVAGTQAGDGGAPRALAEGDPGRPSIAAAPPTSASSPTSQPMLVALLRLLQLPQLAPGRFLADLRRDRRRLRRQFRPRRRLRRPGPGPGRAERAAAAPAVARRGRPEPHRRDLLRRPARASGWKQLRDSPSMVQDAPPSAPPRRPGESFLRRPRDAGAVAQAGCALESCHSPNGFNDFRLRPGSVGLPLAGGRAAQLRGRPARVHGAGHAGRAPVAPGEEEPAVPATAASSTGAAPLLEGPGADSRRRLPHPLRRRPPPPPSAPSRSGTASNAAIAAALVSPLAAGQTLPLAFVARPPNPDGPLEFDTFRGGADLRLADAHLGADGHVEQRGQRPQRARRPARAWPAAPTSTCAARAGATTAPAWCSRPGTAKRAAWICGCSSRPPASAGA